MTVYRTRTCTVSGSTYHFRVAFRDMGGEWDADDKCWRIPAPAFEKWHDWARNVWRAPYKTPEAVRALAGLRIDDGYAEASEMAWCMGQHPGDMYADY